MGECTDGLVTRLKASLAQLPAKLGLPLTLPSDGSVMRGYLSREKLQPGPDIPSADLSQCFHLACLNMTHPGLSRSMFCPRMGLRRENTWASYS